MSDTTGKFHIGDVLSMTTGKLMSPGGMAGLTRLAQHLAGKTVPTHQLGAVREASRQHLLSQFPALANVRAEDVTPANGAEWLNARVVEHGEWLEVKPMPEGAQVVLASMEPMSGLRQKLFRHGRAIPVSIQRD